MIMSEQANLGRAKNALLPFFEHRLYIPKMYIDATWNGAHVDLLAIDRDGSGDVHVVLMFPRKYFSDGRLDIEAQEQTASALMIKLASMPANYKYIAGVDVENNHFIAMFLLNQMEGLFSPDGMGRISLLHIDASSEEDEPKIDVRLRPERFRAKIAQLADSYVQQHSADWEIRA